MDNNDVYVADDADEGITFKKIAYFFKKGWLRMIIYAIAAALVATIVAVPIKVYYKSEPVGSTSVEFVYTGIEKGLAPDGGQFDANMLASNTVLAKAVENAGLDNKIKDISELAARVRVESVLTDEYVALKAAAANGDSDAQNTLRNYDMFPTRFDIIISAPYKFGLSDSQTKSLLNEIFDAFCDEFKKTYVVSSIFPEDIYSLFGDNQLEYTEIYDKYISSLISVRDYVAALAAKDSAFMSSKNNTTFNQLLSELSLLQSDYELFNSYIISNNVWRNPDSALRMLNASKTDITNKLSALSEYITSLKDQIKLIQPNSINTIDPTTGKAVTISTSYPDRYYEYQDKLDEANRQVRDYQTQLAIIGTRIEQLTPQEGSDELSVGKIDGQKLVDLEKNTKQLVAKINDTVEDYYDTMYVSSALRRVQPSVVTRLTLQFSLLAVYACSVLAAVLIACVVTGVKISKVNVARAMSSAESVSSARQDEGAAL